jgi:hypothetical protein
MIEHEQDPKSRGRIPYFIGFLKFGGFNASLFSLCSISLGVGVFLLHFALKSLGFIAGTISLGIMAYWRSL